MPVGGVEEVDWEGAPTGTGGFMAGREGGGDGTSRVYFRA